jgi:hypothetical protein
MFACPTPWPTFEVLLQETPIRFFDFGSPFQSRSQCALLPAPLVLSCLCLIAATNL